MKLLCSFVLILSFLSDFSEGGIIETQHQHQHQVRGGRVKRDIGQCSDKFKACIDKTTEDNIEDLDNIDDRPYFFERKQCNHITRIVEECGALLSDCHTPMYVQDKMDKIVNIYLRTNINGTLEMSSFLADWDNDKCPVVRDFIERNKTKTEDLLDCDDSDRVEKKFYSCWDKANDDYEEAIGYNVGELAYDGRPDLLERKTCNLITTIVKECGKHYFDCYETQSVIDFLDEEVFMNYKWVESKLSNWNYRKCPEYRDYIDRKKPQNVKSTGSEQETWKVQNGSKTTSFSQELIMAALYLALHILPFFVQ